MKYKDTRVLGHLYVGFRVGSTDESRMHDARDVRKRGHSSCNCLGIGLPSGEGARCYFILQTKRDRIRYGCKTEAKGEEGGSKTETKTREHTKKNELYLEAELPLHLLHASRGEVSSVTK